MVTRGALWSGRGAWKAMDTPTFQSNDEGEGQLGVLACLDDAIGYGGAVHYPAKYVDQNGLHLECWEDT